MWATIAIITLPNLVIVLVRHAPCLPCSLCRRENKRQMSPLWQKVYDANYHKSLDHRSFYFKQTDKRLLGAKGMIGDIRGACPRHLLDGLLAEPK